MEERWTPGRLDGKAVRTEYNLPVKFKLEEPDIPAQPSPPTPPTPPSPTNGNSSIPPPPPVDGGEIFKIVDQMPRFPGCENLAGSNFDKEQCAKSKMLEYLYQHITYPVEAIKQGLQGHAVISFNVNKDGSISHAKILRDPGGGLGSEALRAVNTMNDLPQKWVPGRQSGKDVVVNYIVPIKFKLEYNDSPSQIKSKSKPYLSDDPEHLYMEAEEKPIFPGCANGQISNFESNNCSRKKLSAYIFEKFNKNLIPKQGIMTIVVNFIVEKNGKISNVRVTTEHPQQVTQEIERLILSTNNLSQPWIPAKYKSQPIRMLYILPLKLDYSKNR